jgi:hypothetical protein
VRRQFGLAALVDKVPVVDQVLLVEWVLARKVGKQAGAARLPLMLRPRLRRAG